MTAEPKDTRRVILVMVALIVAEFYASLEASMIYTALPTIARDFGDLSTASWLISVYLLVQAAIAAIGGRFGDLLGRRRMIIIVLAISGLGSLISALGGPPWTVIVGRALQGFCGAILPLSFGIVREVAPPSRVPFWVGTLTGAYSGSGAVGFFLGGVLVQYATWHWIFWITSALSLVVIALVLALVPRSSRPSQKGDLDLIGGILFAPGVALTLFTLTKANDWGWLSSATLAGLIGGIALLVLWVWRELSHPNPLIDVRLLGNPQIALGNGLALMIGLGAFQLPLVLNLLMQQPVAGGVGFGVGAALAGTLKLPSNVASALSAIYSGHLASRRGARAAAILGASILAASWLTLTLFHDALWMVIAGSIVCGAANTIVLAAAPNLVLERSPEGRSSEATGVTSVLRAIGTAVGAQAVALLLSSSSILIAGRVAPDGKAYTLALGYIAVTAGVCLVCALLVPRTPRSQAPAPAEVLAQAAK